VAWSYDGLRARRDRESAARDAEMRAARAEGRAEALAETPATRVETVTDVDGNPTGTVAVARRRWWQV
jgi:putative oxidoreductase